MNVDVTQLCPIAEQRLQPVGAQSLFHNEIGQQGNPQSKFTGRT